MVTQNIDGLHQAAGSKQVYELHGSVHRNYCEKCGKFYDLDHILHTTGVPRCDCGGVIKPDVVLYEEALNDRVIDLLADKLLDYCEPRKINLSLPSLRADNFSRELMMRIQKVRKSGLTFAPEAGTPRLRDAINKNVTEEEILPLIDKTVMFISKMEDLLTFK